MSRMNGIVVATVISLLVAGFAESAAAKAKKATVTAAAKAVNACGCYTDATGKCFCGRRGKCDCPGECEPKGCEEKRAKQLQKEIAVETKKAAEADRKERQLDGKRSDGTEDAPKAKPKRIDKDGVGQ